MILGFALLLLLMPAASADENWVQATADAGWPVRGYFSSVAMPDGSIVLMGGYNDHVLYNDTWRSTDNGASWTLMSGRAGWTARDYQSCVAMPDGSIVLIGGADPSPRDDVWRSADNGVSWTRVTAHAGWTPRQSLSAVLVPDGSIVVSGGTLPGGYTQFNDVWRSTDGGATWSEMTPDAGWSKRYGHSSVVMKDGSIVLTGGYTFGPGYANDVWRSADNGASWTEVTPHAGWSARYFHSSFAMPDGSILLAGGGQNDQFRNDVWRSTDYGSSWTRVLPAAAWTARMGQGGVFLPDGSIVLMGGNDGRYRNDAWRLEPAGSPTIVQTASAGGGNGYSGKFIIDPNSTIFLSKTIAPQVMKQGTEATVTITLTNAGLTPIHDVEILDETLPEFPGATGSFTAQQLVANETRILRYTINAEKPGKYTFKGTSVMFAGEDGNYHIIRSNAPAVTVLEPLIASPDQPFDIGRAVSGFFRKIFG